MLGIALILGGVILGATVIAKFWRRIQEFLKKLIDKLKNVVKGTLMGMKIFLRKCVDGVQHITKALSQDAETKKWTENIVVKNLSYKEIPDETMEKLTMDEEFEVTEELKLQLQGG